MVSFTCDACGNTVRKNQVEKHYQTKCRSCSVLSCIDCGVDFPGDSYLTHTSCISEAEKYQGHLYQAKEKENKGQAKQKEWLKKLQDATDDVKDPRLRNMLEKISEYSNVPRKRKQFNNFCKNSVNVSDEKTLDALWEAFNKSKANGNDVSKMNEIDKNNGDETQENGDEENHIKKGEKKRKRKVQDERVEKEEMNTKKKKKKKQIEQDISDVDEGISEPSNDIQNGKFHWHKAIKIALKESDEHQLSMKKLRKKVVSAFEAHCFDHRATTVGESKVLFDKKLKTYPKVKISKNNVKLI